MERTKSRSLKRVGRVGSIGFAALSIFFTSPVFAADVDVGSRDRQSNEWVKDQKIMRSIATEHQAKKDAQKAGESDAKDSPKAADSCAKCSC